MTGERLMADTHQDLSHLTSVVIDGQRTNVRIDQAAWNALIDVSQREHLAVSELCSMIVSRNDWTEKNQGRLANDVEAPDAPAALSEDLRETGSAAATLTTAIRVFIMNYFRHLAQGKALSHDRQSRLISGIDSADPVSVEPKDTAG